MSQIILLKTKSSPTDPYDEFFQEKGGWEVEFVPVLDHCFLEGALDELEGVVREGKVRPVRDEPEEEVGGDEEELGGLLITSQRAVEALGFLLDRMRRKGHSASVSRFLHSLVYVVGPATAKACTSLGFLPSNVLGAHCGSGALLAPYILSSFEPRRSPTRPRKLLFLSGEKRSDIIPQLLSAPEIFENDRVGIREIPMYATENMASFPAHFSSIMEAGLVREELRRRWVVVFSASSCEHVVKVMEEQRGRGPETSLASIGPTTKAYLERVCGVCPEVVAARPSPEGIWEGIQMFERDNGN